MQISERLKFCVRDCLDANNLAIGVFDRITHPNSMREHNALATNQKYPKIENHGGLLLSLHWKYDKLKRFCAAVVE